MTKATNLEDIQGLGGPMTRAKAKKTLNLLMTTLLEASLSLQEEETEMIHLIQIEDLEE